MATYKEYVSEQRVYAMRVDLEFAFDVVDIMEFLTTFNLDWRIGKINNVDHSNPQHFYLELMVGIDDNELPQWALIEHDNYICVVPNPNDRDAPVGVSIIPASTFEANFKERGDSE